MNEYLPQFNKIFKEIIEDFFLKVEVASDDTIFLVRNNFQLEFTMWRENTELGFCLVKSDSEVLYYNVGNFVSSHMVIADRVISEYCGPSGKTAVFVRNVQDLKYIANALRNHFPSMLEGKMDWLAAYEKSEWYSEPRVEKRKI